MLLKIKKYIPMTLYLSGITTINLTLLKKAKIYHKIDYKTIILIN